MTVLFTANYGGYDQLAPVPEIPGVRCIAYTDDPDMVAEGWDVRCCPTNGRLHPRMAAKWFKTHPAECFPDDTHRVWMDAGHRLVDRFAVEAALECVGEAGVALHRHPGRDCIYEEAEASMLFRKYQGLSIPEQAEHYRAEGHPEHWGLWACGTMATVKGPIDKALDAWWDENVRWSYQDQVSFPVVMRRADLLPTSFPHEQYRSPWFAVGGHNRDD